MYIKNHNHGIIGCTPTYAPVWEIPVYKLYIVGIYVLFIIPKNPQEL